MRCARSDYGRMLKKAAPLVFFCGSVSKPGMWMACKLQQSSEAVCASQGLHASKIWCCSALDWMEEEEEEEARCGVADVVASWGSVRDHCFWHAEGTG